MRQPDDPATLDDILEVVAEQRGLDFRAYRPGMVERRVQGRMHQARIESYREYLALLQGDPAEADRLIERLTIKVSRFFRDPPVFDLLASAVVPVLWREAGSNPIRVWSAGCGYGEEAYSLAMLLLEGAPAGGSEAGLVVCATDVDEAALQAAARGVYPESALASLTPERVAAFLCPREGNGPGRSVVRDCVRSHVQFLRHDLASADAAPAGLTFDLVCCRNVLIYFGRELRERAQRLLCSSLRPGGYLCLGEAEWLVPEVRPSFEVVDRKARLFRRNG